MSTQHDKQPRVCLLISTFYPFVGGGETHALLLAREWIRMGREVLVITRRTSPDLAAEEAVQGVPVFRVPPTGTGRLKKYGMLFAVFWRLVSLRRRYDVILVSGLRLLSLPALAAAALFGKYCVLRAASCGELSGAFIWDSPHLERKPKHRALWRWLIAVRNRLYLKAHGFLAISTAIETEYRQCDVPGGRIRTLNNGTDTDRFRPGSTDEKRALRDTLGLPGEKRLLVYSGKLNRGKGLEFLLSLWPKLLEKRDDIHLVLVGSGAGSFLSCEDELKQAARDKGIEPSVTFTGYVENVHEYLRCADLFVFPSENESLSNALIEALASGLPCVASNVGGIPDTVRDGVNGRLLPPRDETAWLEALEALLGDPAQALEWGNNGREQALERNSIRAVAEAHGDFLDAVVRWPWYPAVQPPFQERKTVLRGALDLVTGCYPRFLFGGALGDIVPVFHFHDVTTAYLEPYLQRLAERGYHTVTSEAMAHFAVDGAHPGRGSVVLCFDDAWASLWTDVFNLLKRYDMTAIAYVSPGRIEEADALRPAGSRVPEGSSPLATWPELCAMYDSGTIDVQAHTVSHAMVFSSDRLLGFLQPRTRFSLLSRPVVEFGDRPRCLEPQDLGAPLYPVRSRMSDVWRYRDDDAVRTACIARVKKGGGETFFQKKNWQAELAEIVRGGSGRFETAEERENAVREELVKCREVLGARLRTNTIRQVCLPWGIGGTLAEKAARNAGYETAVADELYGKRFLHSGSNPFRIMRLKHQYIMRLPHNHG